MSSEERNLKESLRDLKKKNRKLEVISYYLIIATAALLIVSIVLVTLLFTSRTVYASDTPKTKMYKSYVIQPGDTLISIAREQCPEDEKVAQFKNELIRINGIKNEDKIIYGNNIIIPYYSE